MSFSTLFNGSELSEFSNSIILGSSSPRRQEILKKNLRITDFQVLKSKFNEDLDKSKYLNQVSDYVTSTACIKGLSIIDEHQLGKNAQKFLLICADTIVECNGEIFEKPLTKENNLRFIEKFQKAGFVNVITAVIVFRKKTASNNDSCSQDNYDTNGDSIVFANEDISKYVTKFKLDYRFKSNEISVFHNVAKTILSFNKSADSSLLQRYIDTEEGLQAAGGFKIQGCGSVLFDAIQGDYFNVVGLPVNTTFQLISEAIRKN